jgi:hypothetical protein
LAPFVAEHGISGRRRLRWRIEKLLTFFVFESGKGTGRTSAPCGGIARDVYCDASHPGAKAAVAAELWQETVGAHEGILGGIGRRVTIPNDPQAKIENAVLVAQNQGIEGFRISRLDTPHQRVIRMGFGGRERGRVFSRCGRGHAARQHK